MSLKVTVIDSGKDSWNDYKMFDPVVTVNKDKNADETKKIVLEMAKSYWVTSELDKKEWEEKYDPTKCFEKILVHLEEKVGSEMWTSCLVWGIVHASYGFSGSCYALGIYLDFQGTLYRILTCTDIDEPVVSCEQYID